MSRDQVWLFLAPGRMQVSCWIACFPFPAIPGSLRTFLRLPSTLFTFHSGLKASSVLSLARRRLVFSFLSRLMKASHAALLDSLSIPSPKSSILFWTSRVKAGPYSVLLAAHLPRYLSHSLSLAGSSPETRSTLVDSSHADFGILTGV